MYGNVAYEKQRVALLLFSIFFFEYRKLYFYRYAVFLKKNNNSVFFA